VTTWGHDPAIISTSNILLTLNDALSHSAILVQVCVFIFPRHYITQVGYLFTRYSYFLFMFRGRLHNTEVTTTSKLKSIYDCVMSTSVCIMPS